MRSWNFYHIRCIFSPKTLAYSYWYFWIPILVILNISNLNKLKHLWFFFYCNIFHITWLPSSSDKVMAISKIHLLPVKLPYVVALY